MIDENPEDPLPYHTQVQMIHRGRVALIVQSLGKLPCPSDLFIKMSSWQEANITRQRDLGNIDFNRPNRKKIE